ncbi:MAG: hypothetical protein KME10_21055, partial [Plectolyngbya sp. WJT66-NPBG17]|nr:hypothetical protein [Plectolyngbya sp. WJT66-NPBG17]
ETVGSTGEAGECQSDAQVALCLSQCNLSSLSLLHIWVAPGSNATRQTVRESANFLSNCF